MQKDDFLQKCKDEYKFNTHQLREVELGFENSLSFDKIEFYAKTKSCYFRINRFYWS